MLPDTRVSPTADLSKASPKRSIRAFAAAINAADPQVAADCFARDACLITPDATTIKGREEIRAVLAQLIARRPQIDIEFSGMLRAGDVVLACQRWRIRSKSTGGEPFVQISNPILVLRCIEDEWKLAIAAPWGWGRGVSQRGEEGGQREGQT